MNFFMAAADIQQAKSTTSKSRSKSALRKKSRYAVLPNLKPGERISSKPNDYDVELSFKGVFGYSKVCKNKFHFMFSFIDLHETTVFDFFKKKIELTRGKLIIKKKNGTVYFVLF